MAETAETTVLAGDPKAQSAPAGSSWRWFVVQVYSGHEKNAELALRERIELADPSLRLYFGEILMPVEEVVEMRGGQQRRSQRKFFPGYLLVQIAIDEEHQQLSPEVWHLIGSTPRVIGFIGGHRRRGADPDQLAAPIPLSEAETDRLMQRIDRASSDTPYPQTLFEPGEMVRVVDGPFHDFNGTVEEVNYEKSRLKISVMIFGRSTPVDLEFVQVEKA